MGEETTAPRALPHDIQAEMGILGSMMLSADAVDTARESLALDSFYSLVHQDIFDAVLALHDARNTVDLILLRDELTRRGKLDQVGGVRYLTEMMEAVPTSANVEYYVEIVREHAVRRHMIQTAGEILKSSYEAGRNVDELLDDSEQRMLAVRHMKDSGQLQTMPELMQAIMERVDEAHANPGLLTGLPTGFADLNEITNGLQPGELIIVAARPSVGKTTLALNMLHYVCTVEQRPAALYSLEMRAEQIVSNLMCIHNRIDTQDFRRGTLNDTQWSDIEDTVADLAEMPLYIDDTPALRLGDLRARARRMRYQHGVELIVVDYLQLLRSDRSRDNRATEVADLSAGIKALARELEIPVLAVAQLNRGVDKDQRRPRMSDLRESGAIEQDADVIMLLHRPDYGEESTFAGEEEGAAMGDVQDPRGVPGVNADVIIAKQRNGPTGVCPLVFWKRYLRFEARSATRM